MEITYRNCTAEEFESVFRDDHPGKPLWPDFSDARRVSYLYGAVVDEKIRGAIALHFASTFSQFLASNDVDLQFIAHGWTQLPEAVHTAITMLVKANISNASDFTVMAEQRRKSQEVLAMRLAQDCRYIIQGCLRDEEWQDADREFFEVIAPRV